MRANFHKCVPVILRYEGGFSNHPRDPGGVTLEGIIQRVYDAYRSRKGLARQALTAAMRGTAAWTSERNEIYRLQYWNAIRGDELPAGVDLVVFDGAVNSGPFQSIKWLQRALGVTADGHFGEATMNALEACQDYDALIADYSARRLGMLRNLSTWDAFGKGWSARVANCKKIGQAWATGSVGPAPVAVQAAGGGAKAYASDVAQPAFDAQQSNTTAVGATGLAGLIQGAKDQLGMLVGTSDFINNVYMALTIASVVIAIGGFAYAWYAHRKSARAQRAIDGDVTAEVPEGQPA
jgi:lysozyme family protein